MHAILEPLIFILSSLITLFIVSNNTSPQELQQGIVVLLVFLILGGWQLFSPTPRLHVHPRLLKSALLFLACLFVQILVVATGGFYSPFLIILYLFTLGSSFLLNLQSSIVFLVFSVGILVLNTLTNPALSQIFSDDPWSIILYIASFIVTIPLTQLLTKTYHVKDVVTKLLSEHLHVVESREETILRGLNEIVFVTDANLSILSANNAALTALNLSSPEITGKPFLTLVPLTDTQEKGPTKESLELQRVLIDKITHIVEGFSFLRKDSGKKENVSIQIRPIGDLKGSIKQIVFVISNSQKSQELNPQQLSIDQAKIRYTALSESYKKIPVLARFPQVLQQFELLEKIRDDLITAIELEGNPRKEPPTMEDIAQLLQQSIDVKQSFAKTLNTQLLLVLPNDEVTELGILRLADAHMNSQVMPTSTFATPISKAWMLLLIQKLIDVAILLTPAEKNATVHILVQTEGDKDVRIGISTPATNIPKEKVNDLFKEYYGELSQNGRLSLGSGLEGILAKRIADMLHLSISIEVVDTAPLVVFVIKLSKDLH